MKAVYPSLENWRILHGKVFEKMSQSKTQKFIVHQ
jgi:hypothetical protein